jgi:chromosome segregation ATPase
MQIALPVAFLVLTPVGAFVGGVMSQIETLMVLALGSALTFVVVLLFGRFFWGMAVSAAAKRTARHTPIEVLDAQAERDKLRAEHALMARKLDLRLEDIKMRMAEQMAEVSRNRNRVQGLVEEIARRDEQLRRKDQENANLEAQIDVHRAELSAAYKTIESQNAEANINEAETTRLQNAFRKVSASMHDKQQAFNDLSDDLRNVASAPVPAMSEVHTQAVLRQRVAEITAITADMKRSNDEAPVVQQLPEVQEPAAPQPNQALSDKIDEAQRLSDDMERELKLLDDMLGLGKTEIAQNPPPAKRQRLSGNVISLAQRIRALQKGMGE